MHALGIQGFEGFGSCLGISHSTYPQLGEIWKKTFPHLLFFAFCHIYALLWTIGLYSDFWEISYHFLKELVNIGNLEPNGAYFGTILASEVGPDQDQILKSGPHWLNLYFRFWPQHCAQLIETFKHSNRDQTFLWNRDLIGTLSSQNRDPKRIFLKSNA